MQNRNLKKLSMRTVLGVVLCGWMLVYLPLSVHAQQNARLNQLKQALKDSRSESSRSLAESAIKAELSSQYDLMLKTNDADLVELEKRVARLKQDLLNRSAAKEQMVDIESQRIINEVNGVVWPGDKVSNTRSGRSNRSMRSSTSSRDRASTRAERYPRAERSHVRELNEIIERIPENAENAYPDISQMRKVYDAAIAYRSVLQKFPANIVDENDKPLLSWRVQVLQFMGEAESNLYKKFKLDEPWDSEHNLPLLKEMPACFKSSDVEDKTKTTFLRVSRPSSKPSKGPLCFLVKSDPSGSAIEWSKPSGISIEQIKGDSYPYIVLYNDGVVAQSMGLIREEDATKFIKSHIGNLMSRDLSEVSNSYASNVQLMAGHEFLKPKFKLGADDARSTGARVDRKRLLAALKAVFATSRAKDPEKVKKMVSGLNVAIIETEAGSFSVAPSDPVSTKSGQLNFSIVPRDVLLKVSVSDHPDFMLFQVRRIDGTLRVVAESLD